MALFSDIRSELRKKLSEKPVITLTESDYEEADGLFSASSNKVKRKKGHKESKRDEWAEVMLLAEDDDEPKVEATLVKPRLDDTVMSMVSTNRTNVTSVKPNESMFDLSIINPSRNRSLDNDEQLYNELFGELEARPKTIDHDLTSVDEPKPKTKKLNVKSEKPTTRNSRMLLDRLDQLEHKYLCEELKVNALQSFVGESAPICDETRQVPTTSEEPEEMTIKFKYLATIHRLLMKTSERFCERFEDFGKLFAVSEPYKLRFFAQSQPFSADKTPADLKLTVCDIVECVLIDSTHKPKNATEDSAQTNESSSSNATTGTLKNPDMLELKLRDSKAHKKQQITVLSLNKFEPFCQLFEKYAQLKQLELDQLRFEFDGEVLEEDQNPTDLDMEDESLIDVIVRQKSD
jgi:hypothetical protein